MQPPQMQFQHKKMDHNFVLILYNFVHQVQNFVQPSCATHNSNLGLVICSTTKCSFNIKNWIIILYSFCIILYTIPSCAIGNLNLGAGEMQPSEMQFQYKKMDHNFVLISYNVVHDVQNFVHPFFMLHPQFKFGGLLTCSPPEMQFQHKKLDHNLVLILYTKSQILYIFPASDKK